MTVETGNARIYTEVMMKSIVPVSLNTQRALGGQGEVIHKVIHSAINFKLTRGKWNKFLVEEMRQFDFVSRKRTTVLVCTWLHLGIEPSLFPLTHFRVSKLFQLVQEFPKGMMPRITAPSSII